MHSRSSIVAQIPGLRRYARALTANAWAADDLVQDTLERACSKWHLWRAGSNLRAWLFTVMHNLAISELRRATREPEHQAANLDEVAEQLVAQDTAPALALALDLQTCLSRLPFDQREVLLLVTLEDMSYEEVARVVGIPVGTVMSRLSRARSRMRECLSPKQLAAPAETEDASPGLRRIK